MRPILKGKVKINPILRGVALLMLMAICFNFLGFTMKEVFAEGETVAVLDTLQYNGIDIDGFKSGEFKGNSTTIDRKDTQTFKVKLPSGGVEIPTVTATAANGGAVEITPPDALPGDTVVKVTEGETIHYYKIIFEVIVIPVDNVYYEGFSGTDLSNWTCRVNGSTSGGNLAGFAVAQENKELKLTAGSGGNNCIFDQSKTFDTDDAMYHASVRFTANAAAARFGIMVRSQSERDHATLVFDNGLIGFHSHNNNVAANMNGISTFVFKENINYDIKVQVEGTTVKLRINDALITTFTPTPGMLPTGGGYKYGFRVWNWLQTFYIDDLYVSAPEEDLPPPDTTTIKENVDPENGQFKTIESADMKVLVGSDFPYIFKYKALDNTFLANGINANETGLKKMVINKKTVNVTSESLESRSIDTQSYKITAFDDSDPNNLIDCEITVELKVTGKNLKMSFTKIIEKNDTIVRTFYIPNHSMVSMKGKGTFAALGALTGWGPMADIFIDLNKSVSSKNYNRVSYALMHDGAANSVAIENNAEDGVYRYSIDEKVEELEFGETSVDKSISFTNTAWYWHYLNKDVPMIADYIPYAEVKLGGDENSDGALDWQDAGLLYRDIMRRPYGSENTKDYWTYIAMNMSSMAGNPSLRILDRAKSISYLTDGFGQKVMNKGYQVGGHDDSHGDYDNVSVQQGGAKDFEYLNTVGKDFNIKTGIHLNASEFALDGFETELENLTQYPNSLKPNWNWFDQAYWVDKEKDIANGDLKRRIDDLKAALPNLDWVYVDVYQAGSKYMAKMLANYLNENGYTVATEAAGDLEEDITLVHWNTDLYYDIGGTQSDVIRFLQNDIADKWAPDRALLSMTMPGVASWRNTTVFSDAQDVFYRNNLAAKYMQYFELQKWTPDQLAEFDGNVKSEVVTEEIEGTQKSFMKLTKDNKLIAKIDVTSIPLTPSGTPKKTGKAEIFIPWNPITEEKIYYYNDNSAVSTWDLPNSWDTVETAYIYKLTPNGRSSMQTITPSNGQITVNGDIATPYIVSKTPQATGGLGENRLPVADGNWGEGSEIKNFGFTGETMESWTVSGNAEILTNQNAKDPLVSFGEGESSISQNITLNAGKTYTISAWVYNEARRATLDVLVNGKTFSKSIDTTDILLKHKPSKFMNTKYQRLDLDVTMPAGITDAKVTFSVAEGSNIAYVDDFRCWQWQTEEAPVEDYYLIKENFENVDEYWGPFVAENDITMQPFSHLAQKDLSENSKQIKNYVIDGQWTLKDQWASNAKLMRTLPSTLKLEQGTVYTVGFQYQTYREVRTLLESEGDTAKEIGCNKPLVAGTTAYSVDVRNSDGTVAQSYPLKASTFEGTTYTYNSAPSVEYMQFDIEQVTPGMYITFSKTSGNNNTIMTVDNFFVSKTAEDPRDSEMTTENGTLTIALDEKFTAGDTLTLDDFKGFALIGNNTKNITFTEMVYNSQANTITLSFTPIPKDYVPQTVRIKVDFKGITRTSEAFILSGTLDKATVAATNGTAIVNLGADFVGGADLVIADFVGSATIGGNTKNITFTSMVYNSQANTVTLSFAPIPKDYVAQSVVVNIDFKGITRSSAAFDMSGMLDNSTVSATNGTVVVNLGADFVGGADLVIADFIGSATIGTAVNAISFTDLKFDATTNTVTLKYAEFAKTEQPQSVVIKVTIKGVEMTSAAFSIDAIETPTDPEKPNKGCGCGTIAFTDFTSGGGGITSLIIIGAVLVGLALILKRKQKAN